MPVMLQVRNLPDDVHLILKRRAAAEGLSLSDYVGRELAALVRTRTTAEVFTELNKIETGITREMLDDMLDEVKAERDAR